MKRQLQAQLSEWPGAALTLALLALAAVIVLIALLGHPLLKVAALAWVILP